MLSPVSTGAAVGAGVTVDVGVAAAVTVGVALTVSESAVTMTDASDGIDEPATDAAGVTVAEPEGSVFSLPVQAQKSAPARSTPASAALEMVRLIIVILSVSILIIFYL